MNCVFAIVLFTLNGFTNVSVILAAADVFGNIPFLMIQRYNRFRLQRLRKTILRKMERQSKKQAVIYTTAAETEI